MSSVKELEEKVKELTKEIEWLKRQEKTEEFEYPFENGEICWSLHIDGVILPCAWYDMDSDKIEYMQGNIFKTKQEAQHEHDKRVLLTKIRQFREKCNGDWKPKIHENKYYITFNVEKNKFESDWYCTLGTFDLFGYFKHKEDCNRAIELFGGYIKNLFVEE